VRLHQICSSLGLECLPAQERLVEAYVELFLQWNLRVNLSAIQTREQVWTHHVADCLAVVPLLRQLLARRDTSSEEAAKAKASKPPVSLLDAGTGAGLPAIILSLWLPGLRVFAVDKVAKKLAFVRQVAAQLGLREFHTVHARLEDLRVAASPGGCANAGQALVLGEGCATEVPGAREALPGIGVDFLISRAFSNLSDLVSCSAHLLDRQGVWLAMKGRYPAGEIAVLARNHPGVEARVHPLEVPSLGEERCVVMLSRKAQAWTQCP